MVRFFLIYYFLLQLNLSFSQNFSMDSLLKEKQQYPRNILKTNPLAVIWSQIPLSGEIRMMYERVTNPNDAAVIGISFIIPSILIADTIRAIEKQLGINLKMYGFRIQIEKKFYLSPINNGKAPKGIYVAPHASVYTSRWYIKGQENRFFQANFCNINFLVGYQLLLWKTIALDACAGLGYRYNYYLEGNSQNPFPIDKGDDFLEIPNWLKISLVVNAGIAF